MSDTRTTDTRAALLPLRGAGVVGLLVAAVIHVIVAVQFGGIFGVLFVLSAIGMAAGAALLLRLPRWGWIVGGAVALLTALGYVRRGTVGLPPLIPNPVPFDRPFIGAVSTVVEIVVVLLAAWALSARRKY